MREMSWEEWFMHSLTEEVRRDAEKQGIRIVDEKSKPKLVIDNVVKLRGDSEDKR